MDQPTCTRCHTSASIYHRSYSGERLCSGCFTATIRERVQKTISRHDMLYHNSRLAVGVSGGKDSLALLHLLTEIEAKHPNAELIAVSIDEGVGGYRDEALSLASKACKTLGIEHHVKSFKDLFDYNMDEIAARKRELAACTYCGVLRRRALNQAAKNIKADRLATAHNLDDMAQTALLNFLRGDLKRLTMMHPAGKDQPGFVRRIKPYSEVPERESAFYAYLKGLEFQNLPCPYASEAMRNDIRIFLNRMEEKRPGIKFTIYRTALKLASEHHILTAGNCKRCGEPTTSQICRTCQLLEQLSENV